MPDASAAVMARSPRADFLLADVGNTFAKFQLADARGRLLAPRRRILTARLSSSALIATLDRWRFRRVALCSVVPAASEILLETLAEPVALLRPGRRRRRPEQFAGVDLSRYPKRRTLGADRLANLAGALVRHGPGPMLVVSLGTAATFDALDAHGRFLGGAIAPGPDALANALHHRTALLPLLSFPVHAYGANPPRAMGLSTRAALRSAAFHGWRGMVKEMIVALCAEHPEHLGHDCPRGIKVVATGGVAPRLARDVPELKTVDPDLTMTGLLAIARAGGLSAHRRRGRRCPSTRATASVSPGLLAAAENDDLSSSAATYPDHTLPLAGLTD